MRISSWGRVREDRGREGEGEGWVACLGEDFFFLEFAKLGHRSLQVEASFVRYCSHFGLFSVFLEREDWGVATLGNNVRD